MTNIESSSPLQIKSMEPVSSELWNTVAIVKVTQKLQRLRIVNSSASSLEENTTNKHTLLQIQIPPYRSEPLVTSGIKPFTDNIAVGEVTRPNSAQTLHSNHSNYLNNQRSSIMNSLSYFVRSKDGREDLIEFVENVKTHVNSDEYLTVAKAEQTLKSYFRTHLREKALE